MITQINNGWITLESQRNGVNVQRAFAGINAIIDAPNEESKSVVTACVISYWERELYPNNLPINTVRKSYILMDLDETEVVELGLTYVMAPLAVLSGFVTNLGYPGIINPARQTLTSLSVLPIDAADGYILHKEDRNKTLKS